MEIAALQNISSFTLLESPIKIGDLLSAAKERGYQAVALADINVTYGLVNFYEQAQKIGIKPLLGMQVRLNGLVDSTRKYDLLVLAKTNEGYRNILRMSSKINLLTENGENHKVVTLEDLQRYLKDLFVIVPANTQSELRTLFIENDELAGNFVRKLQKLVLPDSLYLGVYANSDQNNYINFVKSKAKQFNIPLVAVEDVQYLNSKDHFLRKTLLAIKKGEKLHDLIDLAKIPGSHDLKKSTELVSRYREMGLSQALANTGEIAQQCHAEVVFQKPVLPKYHQNSGLSSQEYLKQLAENGLKRKRLVKPAKQYQDRLAYELNVINEMGFNDYFLIVWDVINYCHQVGITTGPGRGSACGSLVSYALSITDIDPLEYNLLFERFLNPARHEMPDIDLDIPDNRRDEVIKYMFDKYGMDHAAQILTFGTLAAKQALRDVGRVFGMSLKQTEKWTKSLPFSKTKISLKEAYQNSRELQTLVATSPEDQLLFATAVHLEGIPRHTSIHAAGLVISDQSIAGISGMQAGTLGIPVTQQTKAYVESLGLLKIDFLGLRNLTILGQTLALCNLPKEQNLPEAIPLNDPATLKLFQEGRTDAIFQFESAGIKNVLKRLHPDNFEDLVAVNALYRPGPMGNIDEFIARKHGKKPITYPDPSLEKILKPTYGILVYQEQVMQTAQVLAGFSLVEADILRRAMSKKKSDVLAAQKAKFIQGVVAQGHEQQVGERVYSYIEQFANYGFNRSHAVAYTKLAFWLAYLKVHFPAAFYTSMLNSNIGNRTKMQNYVIEAQNAEIRILPPEINHADVSFTLVNGQIITGLRAIKGLRIDMINEIVNKKRPFKSFTDFLRQLDPKFLQTDAIKSLIMAGCFDQMEPNRNMLLSSCEDIIENVKLTGQNLSLSESLGGPQMTEAPMPDSAAKAEMEERVLGFSTTTTPLVAVQKYAKIYNAKRLAEFKIGDKGVAVGKLMGLKPVRTKKGTTMAFSTFADSQNKQEVVIFPGVYEKVHGNLKEGQIYLLGLRVQADRYDPSKKQYLLTNLRAVKITS